MFNVYFLALSWSMIGFGYFTPFLIYFSQTENHLWISYFGTGSSYGSHFLMYLQSGS